MNLLKSKETDFEESMVWWKIKQFSGVMIAMRKKGHVTQKTKLFIQWKRDPSRNAVYTQ